MKKIAFPTELAYLLGLAVLAMGTAMMESAAFGVSMVVAPAYLLHLKLNPILPFFSFGMAEYTLQLALLVLLAILRRRAKLSYLFSFVTAVIYGLMLDAAMGITALLPDGGFALRIALYIIGMIACAAGISLLFHSYIAPEAYELFVKEIAPTLGMPIHRFKTIYDICSCLVAVIMSFAFFGFAVFEGVKLGTVFCALVNGSIIGLFSRLWNRCMVFFDAFRLRTLFE